MRSALFITWAVIIPSLAPAHHSVTGVFDPDEVIEVEGELTRVFWRNPHSRFWITAEDGETWEIEGGALRWLERGGITRDLFVEGERIRVSGNPARRSANEMLAHNILLSGGTEALMSSSALWASKPRRTQSARCSSCRVSMASCQLPAIACASDRVSK